MSNFNVRCGVKWKKVVGGAKYCYDWGLKFVMGGTQYCSGGDCNVILWEVDVVGVA